MLARRIIPTMLCRGRQLVKGVGFDAWRPVGHAAQAAKIHQARGVDELVLLDITATREGRGPDLDLVAELSEGCFMPLAVGGGVRSLDDVKRLLHAGADKVVIGAAAWLWDILRPAADVVGCQAIVVTCDVVDRLEDVDRQEMRGVRCVRNAAPARARWAAEQGAGEILLQSVNRDGTMAGYDIPLIREVAAAVDIPVIASGGAGCYDHMREALEAGASAVAAGAMFQFTDQTPRGAAQYLAKRGIEVRL